MNPRIAIVALWAPDVPAAVEFYQKILGFRRLSSPHHPPHFDVGGIYVVVLQGSPSPPAGAVPAEFPILALTVDDFDAAAARLAGQGVDLPGGVEHNPNMRWVKFRDPAGNLLELVEFGPQQAR